MPEETPLDAQVYSEFVQRLLYMGSVADIQRAVREARNLNMAALYREMTAFEESYRQQGQAANLKLLAFVRGVVNEVIQPGKQATTSIAAIATLDELMTYAVNAPDAIHVYTLLRRYRHLLGQGTLGLLHARVLSFRSGTVNAQQWTRVLCITCLLLGDRAAAAQGHLYWASYCREIKWYGHALRHLAHAEKLAEGVDDLTLRIGVVAARANIYDQLGATAEAAVNFQKALEIALRDGREGLANTTRYKLAGCYRTMGRNAEALELASGRMYC